MRRLPALAALVLSSCVSGGTPAPAPLAAPGLTGAPSASRPRVVVTLVVDQLAGWVAAERWPELPPSGGFARLLREGTWAKEMRYAHAVTDTAPGHSSLYTALTPRESGIFANEVPDGQGGRLSFLRDETAHRVTLAGVEPQPAASLAKLRGDTLADVLHRAKPEAIVLGLSLKDRGALFGGGRSPRAALWFEPKSSQIMTSTSVATAIPSWALPVASGAALARLESQTWSLLDAPWVLSHARTPDDQPGKATRRGSAPSFPTGSRPPRSPATPCAPAPSATISSLPSPWRRSTERRSRGTTPS